MALECAGASLGFASVRAMANVVVNAEIAVIASSSARAADPGKPAIYEIRFALSIEIAIANYHQRVVVVVGTTDCGCFLLFRFCSQICSLCFLFWAFTSNVCTLQTIIIDITFYWELLFYPMNPES